MPKVFQWVIKDDHFSTTVDGKTYKVGDWGKGKAAISHPDGSVTFVKSSLGIDALQLAMLEVENLFA